MQKNPRHQQILDILEEQTYVTAQELSDRLFISLPTVRRDLTYLQQQGLILRNHGGATLANEGTTDIPLPFRHAYKQREKRLLCHTAATLVKDGYTLFIDGSTTLLSMADCLEKHKNITVVTNGLTLAMLLHSRGIHTYCTGGELHPVSAAMAGEYARDFLAHFNLDLTLFSAYGVNDRGMIVDTSLPEMQLCYAAMENAQHTAFVCDSGKFGRNAPFNILPIKQLDYVVTNAAPPKQWHFPTEKLLLAEK